MLDIVVLVLELRLPLLFPLVAAAAAAAAARPTAAPSVPASRALGFVGLAGGGGGKVPIINGDPVSGEERALLSLDEVSPRRRLRSVRGGVVSGDDVTGPAPGCSASAAIRWTRESSSITS